MFRAVVMYRTVCKGPVICNVAKTVVDRIRNEERDGDIGKFDVGQQQEGSKHIDNGPSDIPFLTPHSEALPKWFPNGND